MYNGEVAGSAGVGHIMDSRVRSDMGRRLGIEATGFLLKESVGVGIRRVCGQPTRWGGTEVG